MKNLVTAIALLLLPFCPSLLSAEELPAPLIAVAANFTGAMEKIAAAYEKESGVKLRTVFSSTGKLYAQIKNGAPYDLFLAADAHRPELLAAAGLCGEPFVYATGEAVLWTKNLDLAGEKNWPAVVGKAGLGKIAIASPETAPYGAAAMKALEKAGLRPPVESRLVYGHNVAQPFQFAYQGSVELAFTAHSLALSDPGREGISWPMPEAPPVVQKGCAVKGKGHDEAVKKFLAFFQQAETGKILREFGYK